MFRHRKPVEAHQYLGPDQRPVIPGVCLGDAECTHRYDGAGLGHPHVINGGMGNIYPLEWVYRSSPGTEWVPMHPNAFVLVFYQVAE